MIVYRLAKGKYAHNLSGKGAAKTGGRWNSKGVEIVYTSESRSLCTVEIAVHTPLGILPSDFKLISIEIPDDVEIEVLDKTILPKHWGEFPHSHLTQEIGDEFIRKNKTLVLKVPSAVVNGDYNFLINPDHPDMSKVKIIGTESFKFDKRLF